MENKLHRGIKKIVKIAIKDALIETNGGIFATSRKLDISVKTIRNYINYFPELLQYVSNQSRSTRKAIEEKNALSWPRLRRYNKKWDEED